MTSSQFADQLRPLVAKLGTVRAGLVCGVTDRAIRMWLAGQGTVNLATQTGALVLLRAAAK